MYYSVGDEEQEYLFHNHHMHISMNHIYDILSDFDLKPDTLRRTSRGKYVTGYLELIEELDVREVDLSTVALIVDGQTMVPALTSFAKIADYNSNGIPDLKLKFERMQLTNAIGTGTVEIAIIGSINGLYFQGSDTVKVKK